LAARLFHSYLVTPFVLKAVLFFFSEELLQFVTPDLVVPGLSVLVDLEAEFIDEREVLLSRTHSNAIKAHLITQVRKNAHTLLLAFFPVTNRAQVLLSFRKGEVSLFPHVLVIGHFLVEVVYDLALAPTNTFHLLVFHEQAVVQTAYTFSVYLLAVQIRCWGDLRNFVHNLVFSGAKLL